MNKEGLVLRLVEAGLLTLTGCQSVLPREVSSVSSPTPEPAPLVSQLSSDQPQTPLDILLKEPTLRYGLPQTNMINLIGDNGRVFTLAGPPYLEGVFVLMEKRHAICSLEGDEESEAYRQLKELSRGPRVADKKLVSKVMSRTTSCVPFMERHWQRLHREQSRN